MRRVIATAAATGLLLVASAVPALAGPGMEFDTCLGIDTKEGEGAGGVELCALELELRLPG